ncbi:MAG TPA: nucleotide-binding protein, partial [Nitrososphaera sp.]|nr:nucleotide-binding protein [Nitrososphaera sp.]
PQNVFVVHGRNLEARNALFRFLRSIGLKPLEWSHAIELTGKAAPYIGDILDAAFSEAQAVVVLMTPDDEARLREPYRSANDPGYELELTGQARPNVLFEAGMALGRHPERTVIVELGRLRPFSDIAGRHTIRLDNSSIARQELAQRLTRAGCAVDLRGTDWHREGNFEPPVHSHTDVEDANRKQEVITKGVDLNAVFAILHNLADHDDFYLPHEIPQKVLKNAFDRFVPNREKIMAFLDNTDAYSGCDGLAFTHSGIYWRNNRYEEPQALLWEQLVEMTIRGSERNKAVQIGSNLIVDLSGSSVSATDLARVLRGIVSVIRNEA